MASWEEFEHAAPDLARMVRACMDRGLHKTMATLRRDGSPRISGTEVQFEGGQMWIGSMPGARKAADLRRDGRIAVHSPTADPRPNDPAGWPGEAKVGGRAVEEPFDNAPVPGAHRFRIDIREATFVRLNPAGDRLVVEWWTPEAGLRVLERE